MKVWSPRMVRATWWTLASLPILRVGLLVFFYEWNDRVFNFDEYKNVPDSDPVKQKILNNTMVTGAQLEKYFDNATFLLSEEVNLHPGTLRFHDIYYFDERGHYWSWEANLHLVQTGIWKHRLIIISMHDKTGSHYARGQEFCLTHSPVQNHDMDPECQLLFFLDKFRSNAIPPERRPGDILHLEERTQAPFLLPKDGHYTLVDILTSVSRK